MFLNTKNTKERIVKISVTIRDSFWGIHNKAGIGKEAVRRTVSLCYGKGNFMGGTVCLVKKLKVCYNSCICYSLETCMGIVCYAEERRFMCGAERMIK